MGVPKFFRWISERYPTISQLIAENRIPEFDCLYLDMNGIIHNCTHKEAGEDATFRLSEEEMFIRIFNYIEHLFSKIKPKKLFYMAIDGVAPRAKMNQQRSRRFRTALDSEKAREKAIREGVEMPKEPPFDSNCITPGTEFMAKLSLQLKYFINKKISEDSNWQQCEVVLSGHEVPGEGEHKIMEYIRNAKAQSDYDHNVRHCLYGLDADLIMLGLLSHDPHFCLLREEVTFGRASKSKSKELEHQNFYLLHLCIIREYLELEFQELKEVNALKFPFDLERIIDDFILMAFFVGNDFLPSLPRLHINEGALAAMFRQYKKVLPTCDGYINEGGVIHLSRLAALLQGLSEDELDNFESDVYDEKWFQSKKMEEQVGASPLKGPKKTSKGQIVMTPAQQSLWKNTIRKFVRDRAATTSLNLGSELAEPDRKFVQDLADKLHISWSTKENASGDGARNLVLEKPVCNSSGSGSDDDDEESSLALNRVVRQYDNAMIVKPAPEGQKSFEELYQEKYQAWKTKYYLEKFEWPAETYDAKLVKLCENYVQGLQWVLYYYYRGIASWPWYYAYHYSPLTSDIIKGLGADLNFHKGEPFRPYEQLMGVLPDRSKDIVPHVYRDLMTDSKSPIIEFYPRDFVLDMNGKKMEWEAVVKIPFIDEKRLLAAMEPRNALLTDEEKARNQFGVPLKFTYSPHVNFTYPSSLVGVFPDIKSCHCIENIFDLPEVEGLSYRVGLMSGAKVKVEALAGFPSLHTLPYYGSLVEGYGVNVFQAESRNPSMIIHLLESEGRGKLEMAKAKLGKKCYVGYPFLQEAKVVKVSDELFDYELGPVGDIVQRSHSARDIETFTKESLHIENWLSKRFGFVIGNVETLVHVHMLKGLIKTEEGSLIKEYAENPGIRSIYATQTVVDDVINEDERFLEKEAVPIEEEFPIDTRAFFLAEYNYGCPLVVTGHKDNKIEVNVATLKTKEPGFSHRIIFEHQHHNRYTPSYAVAKKLRLDALVLSKITSSYQVHTIGGLRVNLGLNLKFDARGQKILGYSQKSQTGWEFSQAAITLLANYMLAFPDFFAGISRNPTRSEISDTDIWPDPKVAKTKVKEVVAWLKAQGVNQLERVPLEAEQLDSEVVMALCAAGKQVSDNASETVPKTLRGVPRSAVLKPSDAEIVLSNQTFALGDRVTFVSSSGKVPLGYRGTVVGLSRTPTALLLDVAWDQPFMSGGSLGDRTPPFRGLTVPSFSVLNTSNKQVVSGAKTRKPVFAIATLQNAAGKVAVTQLRDAKPPAALRGSYRGAIMGQNVRGGKAGPSVPPNLQPSKLVYRPTPQQQQPQPRHPSASRGRGQTPAGRERGNAVSTVAVLDTGSPPTGPAADAAVPQYHRVPPPESLDARGRGQSRGRGGHGRGRGGTFRGRGQGTPAQAEGNGPKHLSGPNHNNQEAHTNGHGHGRGRRGGRGNKTSAAPASGAASAPVPAAVPASTASQ